VSGPDYHAQTHRPKWLGGTDPTRGAVYAIKLFGDDEAITTGDGRFIFEIPDDLDGHSLKLVLLYVTTTGSTLTKMQIRNVTAAVDMLTTRIQVDSSEKSSRTASTVYAINTANSKVAAGDQIAFDIDNAGTGAKGLGTEVSFYP